MRNQKLLRKISLNAILIALIALFTFVPNIGFITLGPVSFTDIHIFVLLGALLGGWQTGAITGFTFGFLSFAKALGYPSTVDYLFVNPFVSILPRFLFGLISGLLFDFFSKKLKPKTYVGVIYPLAGVLTFLHTILTLLCLYIFGILDIFKISSSLLGLDEIIKSFTTLYPNIWVFLGSFVALGSIGEIVISIIIVPTIYVIIYNTRKSKNSVSPSENKDENSDLKK